jgi:hypothetical protein
MWRHLLALLFLSGCVVYPGQQFIGARYLNSPLGEGKMPDTDPLIRFDAFDCTTFVETVLADSDLKRLNRIRYKDGDVDFLSRNHFIESDWMDNNSDILENISSKYAKTKIHSVTIDKQNWFRVVHGIDIVAEPQRIDIEYIPYKYAQDIQITKTLVVLFVADNPKFRDTIGTDLAIVHMGLWLPNGMLRHASSTFGKVVDVSMDEYIMQRMKNVNNLGIVLVEIK